MIRDWSYVQDRSKRMTADGNLLPNAVPQQPNYNAAGQGRRLRMWRTPSSGPNASVVRDLSVIRSRARAAARNDPWEGSALDKSDANGIGTGIQAKMVNGTKAEKAAVKVLWNSWCEMSDADGVLDFYGQQGLAWHEWHEAGEIFVRLRTRRRSDGLPVPLQLQLIEPEQCPAEYVGTASNGNAIRSGIEFNAIGQRVAYWMYRVHPAEWTLLRLNTAQLVRVPAEQVIHLYRPLRAGQLRGMPESASVLVRMFNLENMDDAVLERQKIANLFAGFYEQTIDPENPGLSMIDEMTDEQSDTDSDDVPLAGLEPATMQELPPGYKAVFSQPPSPGTDYSEYMRGHLLAIAARRGIPYEVLTGDLRNVSDRALRLILNEFRRGLEMRQWLYFIPRLCRRIREAWFDHADLDGVLPMQNYRERRAELVETLWVPQGWPYSHPVQDVTSDIKAVRAGLTSRSERILSTGEDPEKVDQDIADDNARADALHLVLDGDPRKVSGAGLTQARPDGTKIPPTDVNDGTESEETPEDERPDDEDTPSDDEQDDEPKEPS